jgi:hypothetical protein
VEVNVYFDDPPDWVGFFTGKITKFRRLQKDLEYFVEFNGTKGRSSWHVINNGVSFDDVIYEENKQKVIELRQFRKTYKEVQINHQHFGQPLNLSTSDTDINIEMNQNQINNSSHEISKSPSPDNQTTIERKRKPRRRRGHQPFSRKKQRSTRSQSQGKNLLSTEQQKLNDKDNTNDRMEQQNEISSSNEEKKQLKRKKTLSMPSSSPKRQKIIEHSPLRRSTRRLRTPVRLDPSPAVVKRNADDLRRRVKEQNSKLKIKKALSF